MSVSFKSRAKSSSSTRQLSEVDRSTRSKSNPPRALCTINKSLKIMPEVRKTIIRALGLSLVGHAFKSIRNFRGRGLSERPKIAIRKNRKIALLRSLIHTVPVGVALYEIILNWNTYYVGSNPYNLAVYQFLAKIHELTMQASIAAVVFSFVRSKMALGEGVPFGALFSALQVGQISYLWSMEFWGSVHSERLFVRRKLELLVLVPLSAFSATTCGPSSAILLVPRLCLWPAGSTHIWINATSDELWPSRVTDSAVPTTCSVAPENSLGNDCPSNEWQAVRDWLSISKHISDDKYTHLAIEAPASLQMKGKSSTRGLIIGSFDLDGGLSGSG